MASAKKLALAPGKAVSAIVKASDNGRRQRVTVPRQR
ncbi:MAG: hypothetical protein ACLUEQ_01070 [Cloacibacillus evryensis]